MILDLWRQKAGHLRTLRLPWEISWEKWAALQGLCVWQVVPELSRWILSCIMYFLVTGTCSCVTIWKRTIYLFVLWLSWSLKFIFLLSLPHTDSYFKRLFNFTPAEKSLFFIIHSSLSVQDAIQINLHRGIPECLFYLWLSKLCIGNRIIHTFDLE